MTLRQLFIDCWEFSDAEINRIMDDYLNMRYVEKRDLMNRARRFDEEIDTTVTTYRHSPGSIFEDYLIWMGDYLKNIKAPASYKQRLWERMTKWAINIGESMGVSEAGAIVIDEVLQPVCGDKSIVIIKALHDPNGVTKEEMAELIGQNEKSVRNELRSLNTPCKYDEKVKEVRICGQAVNVPISHWAELDDETRRYRYKYNTRNTLHPLFLQMNVMQVGTMLEALKKAYLEDEKNLSRDIALDIWCQLSDYGRKRIRYAFPDSSDFWDELDEEMEGIRLPHFASEEEQEDDMSKMELLMMHMKGGDACTITLTEDGVESRYDNYYISYEQDKESQKHVYVAKPITEKHIGENRLREFILNEHDQFTITKTE